ncbi:MAG: ABC-ATPase domain-containing protein, partial [Nitrospinota bacterium]
MKSEVLKEKLKRLNGKGYKSYKEIKGKYLYAGFEVIVDHVQGDPFAMPSRVRLRKKREETGFPEELYRNKIRKVAFRDYIGRAFNLAVKKIAKGSRGIGKSGVIEIDYGRQQVLDRSSVTLSHEYLEIHFFIGLPASGRTILGKEAEAMFFQEIPEIAKESLFFKPVNYEDLKLHVETVEDTEFLRKGLLQKKLVGFIGNGANLPRRTGIDDRPLEGGVLFASPKEYEVSFDLPNHGKVEGMGIPFGITLVVGGGFHGKSTVLNALEKGVYNHIPGDGRELVATSPNAVKIRAEDGRRVEKVDISPFINNLPFGKETKCFSTENASGSTSQAANIVEAIELGADLLLMDEDTSATNFMIRDERMQALVQKNKEPITPFIDRAKQIFNQYGVSSVIVIGGSGDYFDIADHVIMMSEYTPEDKTDVAKEITFSHVTGRKTETSGGLPPVLGRFITKESFNPSRGRREIVIQGRGLKTIEFGRQVVDLSFVEQLADPAQTRAVAFMMYWFAEEFSDFSIKEGLEKLLRKL